MAFLINIGDDFKINPNIHPDGCVIMPGLTPKLQLERRKFHQFPLLQNRYFDPQLYCAGLDPNQSAGYCAKLATYPWFGAKSMGKYDSSKHKQGDWMKQIERNINKIWRRNPIDSKKDPQLIEDVVRDCIDFQIRIGCKAIILPSPLTHDPNTDYSEELFWLDTALGYLKHVDNANIPVLATIAIRDSCLTFSDPPNNSLVDMILDSVAAREVDGVYLVIEQGGENDFTRNISNTRVLWSALHMTYLLKHEAGKQVGVNFFGTFGLALAAVGADFWASGWYKSRYRFRIADKIAGGLAYPSCWSNVALVDINLENDLDILWNDGLIMGRVERTEASKGLLDGLSQGYYVKHIPAWVYRPNNNTAAKEHFFQSICNTELIHNKLSGKSRIDYVHNWLRSAHEECKLIQQAIGSNAKTQTGHVQSWFTAFDLFRRDQNL